MKTWFAIMLLSLSMWGGAPEVSAQCPMCKAAVTSTHNSKESKLAGGLNTGILYLFVMPYLAAMGVGILWYRHYKKKKRLEQEKDEQGETF